jgi:ankyrin repeat protein
MSAGHKHCRDNEEESEDDEEESEYYEEKSKRVLATENLKTHMYRLSHRSFSAQHVINLVVREGADPNVQRNIDGKTLLMLLCEFGRLQTSGSFHDDIKKLFALLLARHDIDVHLQDEFGQRCIHHVVNMADRFFLSCFFHYTKNKPRENIDSLDDVGLSALHIACDCQYVPIANIITMLNNGANPHLLSRNTHYSPLQFCLYSHLKHNDLVRLTNIFNMFFDRGLRIDRRQDHRGNTIMHAVAYCVKDDEEFCTKALQNGGGSCLNVTNNDGLDPRKQAEVSDNWSMYDAIVGYMRKRVLNRRPGG